MPHPRHTPAKIFIALLLTFAAGHVDAIGFLAFWHVFTAHMTGNTVHLGMALVQQHWSDALRAGLPVPVFLVGSIVGRCMLEYGARKRWRRVSSLIFLLQAAVVTEVLWMNSAQISEQVLWSSLLLLAFGMGLQTAALTRVGPLTVHTTFVTGMLNSLAQRVSHLLFWLVDPKMRSEHGFWKLRPARESSLLLGVWFCYVTGAIVGAALFLRWKISALFLALAILFVAICVDQVKPLSVEEEEEEAKQEFPLGDLPKAS
jgi:uncharacterized membrane protein YoaK (UPF0700 family)